MTQQWLTLVLNMVDIFMSVILTTLTIQLRSNSGFTGTSLTTLMQFGKNLSGSFIFYTILETSISAISRLRGFSQNVTPEHREEIEDIKPSEDWPRNGGIQLKNISASYDGDAIMALHPSKTLAAAAGHEAVLRVVNI
ncbi:hypothetical protein HYFRA_00006422 [Hymenoscyphus fraxineus]|uniref:Uncharacterized protein n=1 Tax=Hymenoscyphus fraxineus TaxID=746836 RepID=A0A9N9KND0_9HELO|nr:hypothetical protein HYFRA_00006422 [Hymenoscyphus fraxineus]